jgi:hypothetical protein
MTNYLTVLRRGVLSVAALAVCLATLGAAQAQPAFPGQYPQGSPLVGTWAHQTQENGQQVIYAFAFKANGECALGKFDGNGNLLAPMLTGHYSYAGGVLTMNVNGKTLTAPVSVLGTNGSQGQWTEIMIGDMRCVRVN